MAAPSLGSSDGVYKKKVHFTGGSYIKVVVVVLLRQNSWTSAMTAVLDQRIDHFL